MTDSNHVMAEIAWLSRRGRAAAPAIHPLRTAACPPLGALACGLLTDRQRIHVEGCRHCRSVRQAAAQPKTGFAPAVGALAAGLVLAAFLAGWPRSEPARFAPPAARLVEPTPRAVEATWPAPRLPRLRALTPPTSPQLPVIRPLERFEPPEQLTSPVPVALGGPAPPLLEPAPAPDVVSILGLRVL
jgi:hypothetical protein